MMRVRLYAVVVVLVILLCGCSAPTAQQNTSPGPTVLTDPDQVTHLILQHLADKYGEEFVANGEIQPQYYELLGGGTPWILCVYPAAERQDLFCADWTDPVPWG